MFQVPIKTGESFFCSKAVALSSDPSSERQILPRYEPNWRDAVVSGLQHVKDVWLGPKISSVIFCEVMNY